MIPLFLGLASANLILLLGVFTLGLMVIGGDGRPTSVYPYHLAAGIGTGFMCTLAHLSVYMYFMATTKWLAAATDKAALDPQAFTLPAAAAKRRVFRYVMLAIVSVMVAMFAGAAADPTVRPWWPGEVHLAIAAFAVCTNFVCHALEYRAIRAQGALMDAALRTMNAA